MEKIFAKLFELETAQVLVTKDENEEHYSLIQTTDMYDCKPSLAINFDLEENRDKAFDKYDIEKAKEFFININLMLKVE